MASIPGINVAAAIAPFDTADNQASHRALYGQGGLRTVADVTERNAIPSARLEEGMRVYVQSDSKTYVLQPSYSVPTVNSDWAEEAQTAISLPAAGQFNPYGSIDAGSTVVTALAKYNNYIYAGTNSGEIILIDITVPDVPENLGVVSFSVNSITDLKVVGSNLLVCDNGGQFFVADISTPYVVNAYTVYDPGSSVYSFEGMAVFGSRVGLVDSLNSKFVLLDFIDVNNVYRVAELDLPTKGRAVCLQDNNFYVACSDNTTDDGVYVVDINATQILSSALIPETVLNGICANGRYVFCSEGDGSANNTVYVIDIYDPNSIAEVSTYEASPYVLSGKANSFGNFVILTSSTGEGIVMNTTDPLNPEILYNLPVTNQVSVTVTAGIISGGYVIIAYGDDGTGYIDTFQIQNLTLAGINVEAAQIGELDVQKNLNVNGTIAAQKGITAGRGGVFTTGEIAGSRYNGMITADSANGVVLKSVFEVAGVTAPSGAITAALAGAGAGNVDNGSHDYKITFLTNVGESIPISTPSNTITVTDKTTDGKIRLTGLPVSNDAAVIGKRLYRRFNGTGDYLRLATIANSVVSYLDNIANASLTAVLDDEDTSNRTTLGNTKIEKLLILAEQGATSANDVDLPRANTVSLSGNTDVNGFTSTGISTGTPLFLYIPDATVGTITLKHDVTPSSGYAKILTKSGSDIVASAGDTFIFVRTTSGWRQFA